MVKFIQETLNITTLFTFSILLVNYIVTQSVSCNYVADYYIKVWLCLLLNGCFCNSCSCRSHTSMSSRHKYIATYIDIGAGHKQMKHSYMLHTTTNYYNLLMLWYPQLCIKLLLYQLLFAKLNSLGHKVSHKC